jgi:hypothetical protein
MPIIAALANNIVFFITILLCWCPPYATQLEDCFAGERSSLMQIKQFLRKDFGRQRSLDGTKPEQTR